MAKAKSKTKAKPKDPRVKVPIRVMNQKMAERAVKAAQAKAMKLGIETISVAVTDESGNMVFFARGDTCSYITYETCKGKAKMAAGFRRPTKEWEPDFHEHIADWLSISARLDMVCVNGGYPITKDGICVGGIGCGGALGNEDHLCAEAGAKAVSR